MGFNLLNSENINVRAVKTQHFVRTFCFLHDQSYMDRKFMKDEIQHFLENLDFTLCIHERDFLVGESIPANIQAAITHSRTMIMLLSRFDSLCPFFQ